MKRLVLSALVVLPFIAACSKKTSDSTTAEPAAATAQAVTPQELNDLVSAVPATGPRDGNNYKVFFLVLRQDQRPAEGFRVDMWVKGKGEKVTVKTDARGLARFESLPFPDAKHHLNAVLHYFRGANDDEREIDYPFIEGDAYRLKDTQYIPNMATQEAEASGAAPAGK